MSITKENVPFIETPLGPIELYMDGKPALFHTAIWYEPGELVIGKQKTDIPAIRMFYSYQSDHQAHSLVLKINSNLTGYIEPGENFEALTFEKAGFSMTVGCFAAFGEDTLDFDGYYEQNEIHIDIIANTKSQIFCFGTSWMVPESDEDTRAWLTADPFDDWRKYHRCCP